MKIKRIIVFIMFIIAFINIKAQFKDQWVSVNSFAVTVSPYGKGHMVFSETQGDYEYDCKCDVNSVFSIGLHQEKDFGGSGFGHMWGLSYTHAKLNLAKIEAKQYNSPNLVDVNYKTLNDVHMTYSLYYTFNRTHRLKFPVYFGVGVGYTDTDSFKGVSLAIEAKARAKYYISKKVGLFVGGYFHNNIRGLESGAVFTIH